MRVRQHAVRAPNATTSPSDTISSCASTPPCPPPHNPPLLLGFQMSHHRRPWEDPTPNPSIMRDCPHVYTASRITADERHCRVAPTSTQRTLHGSHSDAPQPRTRVCPASQPAPAPSCVGSSYVGAAGGGGQETSVVLGASTCRFGQHSTTIRPIFSCISAAPSSQPILCTERESTVNKSGVARNTTLRVPRTRPSVLERAAHSTRSIGAHTR